MRNHHLPHLTPPVQRSSLLGARKKRSQAVQPSVVYGSGGQPYYIPPCTNRRTGQTNPYHLTGGEDQYQDSLFIQWNNQCEAENNSAPIYNPNPGGSYPVQIPTDTYGTDMSTLMHERNCVDNFRCYWDNRSHQCVSDLWSGQRCQAFYNSLGLR